MVSISVFPSPAELGAALARTVSQTAAEAAGKGGRFALGLSGGSLVDLLARELPAALRESPGADLSRWIVAFCDERLVPPEHPESTFGAYRSRLFSQLAPPAPHILSVDPSLSPAGAAADYWEQIQRAFPGVSGIPQFDLLLLGIGPDGHTCSLFPGHPLLQEQDLPVASLLDSPKPPPARVTMTFPLLNSSKSILFVASGSSKASVLKRILEGNEENPLPAALVKPKSGKIQWFVDEEAARELEIPWKNIPKSENSLEKNPKK